MQKKNIIHRDIKPQNIFINDNGDFKLGDFGIAKTADHTTVATKAGTFNYMAPEVYFGNPYNHSVDIYSLGLVLYWLLNERRGPFLPPALVKNSDSQKAQQRRFGGEALPPPAHGSAQLRQIVQKACAFDPADRYASATQMMHDLEALTGHVSPVSQAEEDEEATILDSSEKTEVTIAAGSRREAETVLSVTPEVPVKQPPKKPDPISWQKPPVTKPVKKQEPRKKKHASGSKKKMKFPEILAIFLIQLAVVGGLILIFGGGSSKGATSGKVSSGIRWDLTEGTLTISGQGAMDDFKAANAPWYDQCEEITSIIIEDGITRIGEYAFYYCENVATVTMTNSVTEIGDNAFLSCESLAEIQLPTNLETIGKRSFANCKNITAVEIPGSVSLVEDSAFENTGLTSVKIGENTVFHYDSFPIFATFHAEQPYSTSGTWDNTAWNLDENGTLTISGTGGMGPEESFAAPWLLLRDKIHSVVVEDGIASVHSGAFYGCTKLASATLPDSIGDIYWSAFAGCQSLKDIVIPEGTTALRFKAFWGCFSLESITLPSTLTDIDPEAFSGCSALTAISLPSGITDIGSGAFRGCEALKTVVLPEKLLKLGFNAFEDCTSLESVTLPNDLEEIGDAAFSGCTSLKSISIPEWITEIKNGTFHSCTSLASVQLPEKLMTIQNSAFTDCTALTSITIPQSVTTIDVFAFAGCTSLKTVNLPSGLTELANCLFMDCPSLTDITIPNGVTAIGKNAFFNCSSLGKLTIPSSVTTIGNNAFDGCSSLTELRIPDSVTSLGYGFAQNCTNLNSIFFPKSVKELNPNDFMGCGKLRTVTVASNCVPKYENSWPKKIEIKYYS